MLFLRLEVKLNTMLSISRCYRGGQNSKGTSYVDKWWDIKLNKALCIHHHLGKMARFADEVLNVFLEYCKPEIDCLICNKKKK